MLQCIPQKKTIVSSLQSNLILVFPIYKYARFHKTFKWYIAIRFNHHDFASEICFFNLKVNEW